MTLLFVILIILSSAILGFIVLVQNPKGGGLAGNVAGFSTQFMGVKQTNDVLEKGTWIFAALVGVLCLVSSVLIPTTKVQQNSRAGDVTAPVPTAPANNNAVPFNQGTQPAGSTSPDSGK